MMTLTHTVGDVEIRFTPPPTAKDVLDWTVWIAARDTVENAQQVAELAVQWAAQFVRNIEALNGALEAIEPASDRWYALVGLCNAIANSAGLPPDVLDDFGRLLARKTAMSENWLLAEYERFRPAGACGCMRCRAAAAGIEKANPKGERCVFDDIDHRAVVPSRAVSVENPSEPYYLTQIRGLLNAEEMRRWQYQKARDKAREGLKDITRGKR